MYYNTTNKFRLILLDIHKNNPKQARENKLFTNNDNDNYKAVSITTKPKEQKRLKHVFLFL